MVIILKKKMIKANKFKSHACLILGDEEWKEKKIIWKNSYKWEHKKSYHT